VADIDAVTPTPTVCDGGAQTSGLSVTVTVTVQFAVCPALVTAIVLVPPVAYDVLNVPPVPAVGEPPGADQL
jgi:hypothetical protein